MLNIKSISGNFLFAAVLAVAFPTGAQAAPFALTQILDDPTPVGDDRFGGSVAIDGNNVLVGATGSSDPRTSGLFDGQVHLFNATTGTLQQTFRNPTPTNNDQFGSSVAIDGNNVLIGAFRDDTNGLNTGQAHLFDATTGALLRTFNDPAPAAGAFFGSSVTIDANKVLIGARSAAGGGAAHLFDATSGALLRTFSNPSTSPTVDNQFGRATAIDGNNLLIGANGGAGAAYLYDMTTGALLQTFSQTLFGNFGGSLSLSGNNVLIGASGDDTNGLDVGRAFLFDATSGALLQTFDDPTPTGSDRFGNSVAIFGNNVLIGAYGDDGSGTDVGQAYLFDLTTGLLLDTFIDPTVTGADSFGISVAMFGDTVVIGANGDDVNGTNVGQAYLYARETGSGTPASVPGTLAIFGLGLYALGFVRRRKAI